MIELAVTTTTKRESVEQFIEQVFNGRDYDAASEYFSPDVVQHAPGGQTVEGIDAVVGMLQGYHAAFSDLEATEEAYIEDGDIVVCRYSYHGTHDGEFMGIEPTGTSVEVSGLTMHRFEGDSVAEVWVSVDMMGAFQQIGVFPPASA